MNKKKEKKNDNLLDINEEKKLVFKWDQVFFSNLYFK